MSGFDIRNGVTITVESTGRTYHTYNDWGLYVANNDCIGEPEQYTNYVEIIGRNGKIDLSEAVANRPVFLSREIKIYLAGFNEISDWDIIISAFRNRIMGKVCKITFDTDPGYYWYGRVGIIDFKPVKEFGKFLLSIPEADPYKYSTTSSAEPWLWDPFNFETDVITYAPSQIITGSGSVTIPSGHMLTSPTFVVSDIVGDSFTVSKGTRTYALVQGSNEIPSILVGGDEEVELLFTGTAKVQILYRSGSL